MKSLLPHWFRAGLLLATALPASLLGSACRQRDVCEDVAGPCLALRVVGPSAPGMYDELRTTLQLEAAAPVRSGTTTGEIALPLTLRVVPPTGVLPSTVRGIGVAGVHGGADVASAQTPAGFAWADDEHLTVMLELTPTDNSDGGVSLDMGDMSGQPPPDLSRPGDLAQPPVPSLKWFAEANSGAKNELYHVWAGSGTQAFAVGTAGTVLSRQAAGSWSTEAAGITGDLYGVFGIAGGSVWVVGDSPGAWRRDAASGKWLADQSGLALGPQGALWSVITGAAAGELWAGGEDGKVWHRIGNPNASGTWQSEQALPAGVTVFGIGYADGAVFAVGQRGYASVRKDSGGGARWQTSYQYPALSGKTMGRDDGLYGVHGFDRNSAVAVGSKGLLVRYTGGSWQPTPQSIDANANEFNSVWGTSPGRVWAVGYDGLIVRLDGTTPTELRSDNNQSLYGVFGRSESDIFAVGSSFGGFSLILHGQP